MFYFPLLISNSKTCLFFDLLTSSVTIKCNNYYLQCWETSLVCADDFLIIFILLRLFSVIFLLKGGIKTIVPSRWKLFMRLQKIIINVFGLFWISVYLSRQKLCTVWSGSGIQNPMIYYFILRGLYLNEVTPSK